MTLPALIFSIIISALYATIYHFFRGDNIFHLFVYVVVAVGGFFIGQYLDTLLELKFFQIGTINFATGSFFSIVLLLLSGWISRSIK